MGLGRSLAWGLAASAAIAAAWAAWPWRGQTAEPAPAAQAVPSLVPTPQPLPAQPSPSPAPSPVAQATNTAVPTASATAIPSAAPQAPATLAYLQRPHRWHYGVSTSYLLGADLARAEMSYQPQGQRYQARLKIQLLKQTLFDMRAKGHIGPHGLQVQHYEEKGLARDGSVYRQGGQLHWPQWQRTLPPPAGELIDSVSIHMQLQQALATGALRPEAGQSREVWLMRPEGLFRWAYEVQGRETLDIAPLGPVATVHIVPRALGNGTTKSELWFAPEHDWAPVRIKMAWADGGWLELNWRP